MAKEEQLSDEIRATRVDPVINHGSHCCIFFLQFLSVSANISVHVNNLKNSLQFELF